jgi:uncharacterized delta-60 repeat protein
MQLSALPRSCWGRLFVKAICLLLLSCVSTPLAGQEKFTQTTPAALTDPLYLPLVLSAKPPGITPASGFGTVTLAAVVNESAWQDDKTLLVVGTVITRPNADLHAEPSSFALARYFHDGMLDRSFGQAGHVTTSFAARSATANALLVQSDGKIVVVGHSAAGSMHNPTSELAFTLARYLPDGALDTTFGAKGKIIADLIPGNDDLAQAIVQQNDAKLLVIGYTAPRDSTTSAADFIIARFKADGTLDQNFGDQGKRIVDFGGSEFGKEIAILAGEKFIAGGDSCCDEASNGFVLSQFHLQGSVDPLFGNDGKVFTEFSHYPDQMSALLVQPDEKVIVVGCLSTSLQMQYQLARYHADGSLDTTFGEEGKAITDLASQSQCANAAALQSDGKLIVVGYAGSVHGGCRCRTVLLRYHPDGTLDNTFGSTGIVADEFSENGPESANALLLTPDLKIIMIGLAAEYAGPAHLTLARYHADGSRDDSFVFRP